MAGEVSPFQILILMGIAYAMVGCWGSNLRKKDLAHSYGLFFPRLFASIPDASLLASISSPAFIITEAHAEKYLSLTGSTILAASGCSSPCCSKPDAFLLSRTWAKAFSASSNFLIVASRKPAGNGPSASSSLESV